MTTVVGLITDNDETAYRRVRDVTVWCKNNKSLPQHDQDKGEDCGLQEKEDRACPPILIDGAVVEQFESFKFLGIHITNKLTWSNNTKTVVKRA